MVKNIVWKGIDDGTMEYCRIQYNRDAILVASAITGHSGDIPVQIDYNIKLTNDWNVQSFTVNSNIDNVTNVFALHTDGKGTWFNEIQELQDFRGCYDIDIVFTPFTNSLPVNRLSFSDNETKAIDVVYINALEASMTRKQQFYTRLDEHIYHFENNEHDFVADIEMDSDGLVVSYPGLFERVLAR